MYSNTGSSASSRLEDGETNGGRRSKRRRVTEPERKRVAKACSSCRRLKEKCDGGSPCNRCVRYGRTCEASSTSSRPAAPTTRSPGTKLDERIAHLEAIAKHFLGEVSIDESNLKRLVQDLGPQSHDTTSPVTFASGGKPYDHNSVVSNPARTKNAPLSRLSDSEFENMLRVQVNSRLEVSGIEAGSDTYLESPSPLALLSRVSFRREDLPPKEVALFLSGVYFDFAQTTILVVDKMWAAEKLENMYSWTRILTPQDHPWICSVLILLAIGVQFAHLVGNASQDNPDSSLTLSDSVFDHDASIRLYRMATDLLPDLLLTSSVDSLQALILIAHFSLCLNDGNLAHKYLSLAVSTAAQMDKTSADDWNATSSDSIRTLSRLSQIAYSCESRISTLYDFPKHGQRPSEKFEEPQTSSQIVQQQQISLEASTTVFVLLTDWLGRITDSLSRFRQFSIASQVSSLGDLLTIRRRYKAWWPERDLSRIPILQLNRNTAPLHLCYHLNLVIIGRSFIFQTIEGSHSSNLDIETHNTIAELVDDAEYSAYEIIDICAMLDKSVGLTGASWLEFSICQAAVLVMLAQSLIGRCHLFRGKLQQGVELIRKMAMSSARGMSGISSINAISDVVEKLAPHKRNQKYKKKLDAVTTDRGYRSFQDWARTGDNNPPTGLEDIDALIRENSTATDALNSVFNDSQINSTLFGFEPVGFGEFDPGLDVY